VWKDGREVAVKIQYPGAGAALKADLDQVARMAPLLGLVMPGVEFRPLLTELRARIMEEIDYAAEADHQRAFAAGYADDPEILVPRVVASAPKVIVSEWVSGTPLSAVIRSGSQEQRDLAGRLMTELHFSAPQRIGLLHADPHPGNYQVTDDGRLAVIDFGAVARVDAGIPRILGRASRLALAGRHDEVLDALRHEGFIPANFHPDPQMLVEYLIPFIEPLRTPTFHFSRAWMQRQANRMGDFSSDEFKIARRLNLPPSYLMIHRVTFGSIGVLCQLDATAPFRGIVERWLPDFTADEDEVGDGRSA
jgi:predicted unusual protein kinase regulating ubiquinone biosynthesis (AarF/ABC1/UbiB family)